MELQNFVTAIIESLGGVVVPLEYALCHVLVPEECAVYFQDRTELMLAFDFEVAQENPQAEFVTFGSYILDQLLELVRIKPIATVRYAIWDERQPANPAGKIKQYLQMKHSSLEIIHHRPIMGIWAAFVFCIKYRSDEITEEIEEVWINLLTGKPSKDMAKQRMNIFYETRPVYALLPIPADADMLKAFETAYNVIKDASGDHLHKYTREEELKRECQRIEEYYDELEKENQRRMERKGISDERKQALLDKQHALKLEMKKQISELKDKYTPKIEINLDHAILYAVPQIEYELVIRTHDASTRKIVYYNPVLKSFEE